MTNQPEGMSLGAELARMTAFFQLRTVAMHMGADPNTVDPDTLTFQLSATPFGAEATATRGSRPNNPGRGDASPHLESLS